MRVVALLLLVLCLAADARAQSATLDVPALVERLRTDPVVVEGTALGVRGTAKVRTAIAREAPGRLRVLVVPPSGFLADIGALESLANRIDDGLGGTPGALLVTTGELTWVVTSHSGAAAAADAVRRAAARTGLAAQLAAAVTGIAAVDPGIGGADPGEQQEPSPIVGDDAVSGFLDDVAGTFRLAVLGLLGLLVLPIVLLLALGGVRLMRRRRLARRELGERWAAAQAELLELAGHVREHELDVASLPPEAAPHAAYVAALEQYEQASAALGRPAGAEDLRDGRRALDAGRAHVAGMREALGHR